MKTNTDLYCLKSKIPVSVSGPGQTTRSLKKDAIPTQFESNATTGDKDLQVQNANLSAIINFLSMDKTATLLSHAHAM